jgi:hypothetical protein
MLNTCVLFFTNHVIVDMSGIDDLDDLEVYGANSNQSGSQITQYTFEVCISDDWWINSDKNGLMNQFFSRLSLTLILQLLRFLI